MIKMRKLLSEAKFQFRDCLIHSIRKIPNNKLKVDATCNIMGKEYSYVIDIPNDNYDLTLRSDKEMIAMIVKQEIQDKIYGK